VSDKGSEPEVPQVGTIPSAFGMHEAFDVAVDELGADENAGEAISLVAACALTEALIGIKYELECLNRNITNALARWRRDSLKH